MPELNWLLGLFRLFGVLVGMSAAVVACWLLGGRKFPQQLSAAVGGWLLLIVLWGLGGYALTSRYALGLGAVTNLSYQFPWGLWKALVRCRKSAGSNRNFAFVCGARHQRRGMLPRR